MSPVDDTFLTSSADGGVRLWNLQQAGSLASMDLPRSGSNGVTIDPNGSPNAAFDCTGLVFGISAPLDANAGNVSYYFHLYFGMTYACLSFHFEILHLV